MTGQIFSNLKLKFWQFYLFVALTSFFLNICVASHADINVTFYSHDYGKNYPHTFFIVRGTRNDGTEINENYGFTAVKVTPKILMGSVTGTVKQSLSREYIESSDRQFLIGVDDAHYENLIAVIEKWRNIPHKSYNLNKRNCVHFVGDALISLGYTIDPSSKNFKKPRSFLHEVKALNPELQTSSP